MNERELIQKWIVWKEEDGRKPFSQKTLAESAGISPTYLSSIMTGTRNAGTRTVERIAGAFGVTLAGFYSGPPDHADDRMEVNRTEFREEAADYAGSALSYRRSGPGMETALDSGYAAESPDTVGLKLFRSSPDEIERLFGMYGYALRDDAFPPPQREGIPEDIPEPRSTGGIPLLTQVPEGPWSTWFPPGPETVFAGIRPPLEGEYLFSVPLTDDSMSPVLERGSLVVADPHRLPIGFKGEIAIVAHRGRFRIRRVYASGESLILVPANPACFPEVIPAEESEVFVISFHIPPRRFVPA